jgi:hypothetical protein
MSGRLFESTDSVLFACAENLHAGEIVFFAVNASIILCCDACRSHLGLKNEDI